MWIGGGFDGFEDGVGSRLFPTMVEDFLHHLMRDVRSRHLVFRCVFRWMPFRMSAASCMSGKSGGDLILRHVPSNEGFDKMERPCDTCSSFVRILTRVPTMKHVWCVMVFMGLGFWATVYFSWLSLLFVLGSISFCIVFGFCPLDSVHLIKSR